MRDCGKELSPGLELPSIPSPHQTNTSPQVDESCGSLSKRLLEVSSPTRGDRRLLGLVGLSKGEGPSKDEVLASSLKKRTERPGETLAERNVKRPKQDQQQRTSRGKSAEQGRASELEQGAKDREVVAEPNVSARLAKGTKGSCKGLCGNYDRDDDDVLSKSDYEHLLDNLFETENSLKEYEDALHKERQEKRALQLDLEKCRKENLDLRGRLEQDREELESRAARAERSLAQAQNEILLISQKLSAGSLEASRYRREREKLEKQAAGNYEVAKNILERYETRLRQNMESLSKTGADIRGFLLQCQTPSQRGNEEMPQNRATVPGKTHVHHCRRQQRNCARHNPSSTL